MCVQYIDCMSEGREVWVPPLKPVQARSARMKILLHDEEHSPSLAEGSTFHLCYMQDQP